MRVAVAMSGGVDSSVAAALLKEAGHDVVGVTLKVWDESRCCSLKDADDARKVAGRLDIPHFVLDSREAFEEEVISPFLASYGAGQVPNPCVLCNRRLKFHWLWERVRLMGCEKLATGHYAMIAEAPEGGLMLLRGRDQAKDQSYFVAPPDAEYLSRLLFPLGGFTKAWIREKAASLALSVAEKPDSQDLCFLPGEGLSQFIEMRLGPGRKGAVVDLSGKLLGTHTGAHRFTLGQRRGLGIASPNPLYVVRKELAENRVVLGPREALQNTGFTFDALSWLLSSPPADGEELFTRTRSTGKLSRCLLYPSERKATLVEPQFAVTPGQLAVFYRGERVAGSAWIEAPLNAESPWK